MGKGSFLAYIDESGDEGFTYDAEHKSSEWFVLSAIVVRRRNERALLDVWRQIRGILGKPTGYTLHFRDLKHEQKVVVASKLVQAPMRWVSVVCHKPSLVETEYLRGKSRLYFYLSRLLFERISWLCRDARRKPEEPGGVDVVFSNRSSMSYDELKNYLDHLRERSQTQAVEIDWTAISTEQISTVPHRLRDGLQIADAVASGLYCAFEPSRYGFTEARYARELMPVAYRHQGRQLIGYGVKIWPAEKLASIRQDDGFAWLFDSKK